MLGADLNMQTHRRHINPHCGLVLLSLALLVSCDAAPNAGGRAERTQSTPESASNGARTVEMLIQTQAGDIPTLMDLLYIVVHDVGWTNQWKEVRRCWPHSIVGGRAVEVTAEGERYVVVVLGVNEGDMPSAAAQVLLLLDGDGALRDRLDCVISTRTLFFTELRRLHTVVLSVPGGDGAQLVVRLDGASSLRGNFSHRLWHGNQWARFYWGWRDLPKTEPTKWDMRGLCRLRIVNGAFQVLFPTEEDEDKGFRVKPK